jgi:hypothetical protein
MVTLRRKMAQTWVFPAQMCPQAAPLLAIGALAPMATRMADKSLDFKAFCTACFVIDLSQAQRGATSDRKPGWFFTKLSTESVHGIG